MKFFLLAAFAISSYSNAETFRDIRPGNYDTYSNVCGKHIEITGNQIVSTDIDNNLLRLPCLSAYKGSIVVYDCNSSKCNLNVYESDKRAIPQYLKILEDGNFIAYCKNNACSPTKFILRK